MNIVVWGWKVTEKSFLVNNIPKKKKMQWTIKSSGGVAELLVERSVDDWKIADSQFNSQNVIT